MTSDRRHRLQTHRMGRQTSTPALRQPVAWQCRHRLPVIGEKVRRSERQACVVGRASRMKLMLCVQAPRVLTADDMPRSCLVRRSRACVHPAAPARRARGAPVPSRCRFPGRPTGSHSLPAGSHRRGFRKFFKGSGEVHQILRIDNMFPKRCIGQPAKVSYRRCFNCPIPEIPPATFRQVEMRVMPSSLLHGGISVFEVRIEIDDAFIVSVDVNAVDAIAVGLVIPLVDIQPLAPTRRAPVWICIEL
ncbi:hypothetical protein BamMEX5DRAFT_4163 [Burkholderia ambifaria MEX-5]|uniref:Uncharacterized protein n=1 Tax=Burkholderia ambifaria MEX-5 TaxID=396597 RepID=B1T8P7_9BURK|nr:hypothetical protein BamMEX5DRAFT_4163 [Burkholderia ambifaria MEX-5]